MLKTYKKHKSNYVVLGKSFVSSKLIQLWSIEIYIILRCIYKLIFYLLTLNVLVFRQFQYFSLLNKLFISEISKPTDT